MGMQVCYVTLSVEDLERSISFYRDILGFELFHRVEFPEGFRDHAGPVKGIAHMRSGSGSTMIELIQNEGMPLGMYSIGMDVDSLDGALAHVRERGCEPVTPVIQTRQGPMTFIKDPDGVSVCLIEHDKA